MLDEPFNADEEEGTKPPELLPSGKYGAEIEDAYVATTKNGNGQMVCLKWRIVEGEHENRVVFDQILVQHTSALEPNGRTAKRMAQNLIIRKWRGGAGTCLRWGSAFRKKSSSLCKT
jgi:hypothetical protein